MKDDRVRDDRVLVYSTDGTVPRPPEPGRKRTQPTLRAMPGDGVIRVARERRRNSALTIVHGLAGADLELAAKELRRLCATGGTVKNGAIELQGDHRERVASFFTERGRRVKLAGG